MNDTINYINIEGIKFFGKVNASISHELKNILAIISETVGFINDLTDLAKQGKDLKLSLLEGCSDSIAEDIERGFETIKNMNKFAHSVDVPIKKIDLLETLQLTIKLSKFLSIASNTHVTQSDSDIKPVLTCPFLLQNLIYYTLLFLYESIGSDGEVHIQFESPKNDGTHLIFTSPGQLNLKEFPTSKIKKTAEVLGIKLKMTTSPFELDLWIPFISNEIVVLVKEMQIYSHV